MTSRIIIPAEIGNFVLGTVEKHNDDTPCYMVLMVFPLEADGKLGQPAFLTNLLPDEMEDVVIQVAGNFALLDKSKRIIDGISDQ